MDHFIAKEQNTKAPDAIANDVFLDGETLYVLKSKMNDHLVMEYIEKLERIFNLDIQVEHTSREEISKRINSDSENKDSTESEKKLIQLLEEAHRRPSSDIHIDVNTVKGITNIRTRVFGDLEDTGQTEIADYGRHIGNAIFRLIDQNASKNGVFSPNKSMAARIGHSPKLPKGIFGVRVQNVPSNTGNRLVLRILSDTTGNNDLSLESLGFTEEQLKVLQMLKKTTHGMILFSGPTGSGKTTSMHRYLTHYNRYHKRTKQIYTIEDPVELIIEDAVQTEIPYCETEEERQKAFQVLLNDALRADPDLVMMGEVRDAAGATIALRAALTGHQMVGTVHANTPLGIMQRLIDIGASPNLIYDHETVIGLIAQRLVRILCDDCKEPLAGKQKDYDDIDWRRILNAGVELEKTYVKGCGCSKCNHRGYIGREVVAQTIRTDLKLMTHLKTGDVIGAIKHIKDEIKAPSIIALAIKKINEGRVDPFDAESQVGLLNMDIIDNDNQISMSEIASTVGSGKEA